MPFFSISLKTFLILHERTRMTHNCCHRRHFKTNIIKCIENYTIFTICKFYPLHPLSFKIYVLLSQCDLLPMQSQKIIFRIKPNRITRDILRRFMLLWRTGILHLFLLSASEIVRISEDSRNFLFPIKSIKWKIERTLFWVLCLYLLR